MSTGKIRVYEIAKKIGMSSKELIEKLNKNGFDVKNHMSGIDINREKNILEMFELKIKNNKREDLKPANKKDNVKTENKKALDEQIIKKERQKHVKKYQKESFDQIQNIDIDKSRSKGIKQNVDFSKNKEFGGRRKVFKRNKINENKNLSYEQNKNSFYEKRDSAGKQESNAKEKTDFYEKNIYTRGDEKKRFLKDDYHDSKSRNSFYKDNRENKRRQNQTINKFDNRNAYKKQNSFGEPDNNLEVNRVEVQMVDSGFTRNQRGNRSFKGDASNKTYNNSTQKQERINSGFYRDGRANFNSGDNNRKVFNSGERNNNANRQRQIFNRQKISFGAKNKAGNLTPQSAGIAQQNNNKFAKSEQFNKKFNANNNLRIENQVFPEKKASKSKKEFGNNRKQKDISAREREKEALFYDLQRNKSKSHKNKKHAKKADAKEVEFAEVSFLRIPSSIVVKELADKIKKPVTELIKLLMGEGLMLNQNQVINFDLASRVLNKLNIATELLEKENSAKNFTSSEKGQEDMSNLKPRPPVVVVMGHVDHGKTSLLDAIRNTNVISTEAGGITQHIGAYTVLINGRNITFLDTPGHEAFTAMRKRGAQVTDIAILVVAADDGIMPQTIEAIDHAKAAGVEIIVAINKIDKPGANIEKVKQELIKYDLLCEEWGGRTICVPISAKNKIGIEDLLEMVLLVAEMKELKANPNKKASGIVIEAKLDKGRGSIATVLVQDGTLKIGNSVVVGKTYGKIRAMIDDKNKYVKQALPSTPVEILGLSSVPNSGEIFYVVDSDKQAKQIAEENINKSKTVFNSGSGNKVSLDDLFCQIKTGNIKDLALIIKADVDGSGEALKTSLEHLSDSKVKIRVIHSGVGAVSDSDVMLAAVSNAIIIGFNVRPENSAKVLADSENVDIKLYKIIYDAIEDIKLAMHGLLEPLYEEKIIGHAEVRKIFKISKVGTVAGCYITNGKVFRNSKIRVVRDGKSIYESEVASLRREKDDVKEVNEGYECGIMVEKFNDVKENDILEFYIMEEAKE